MSKWKNESIIGDSSNGIVQLMDGDSSIYPISKAEAIYDANGEKEGGETRLLDSCE